MPRWWPLTGRFRQRGGQAGLGRLTPVESENTMTRDGGASRAKCHQARSRPERRVIVEPVHLTNEAPAPTTAQPQGTAAPNEAEAAKLADLRAKAQEEEKKEEE